MRVAFLVVALLLIAACSGEDSLAPGTTAELTSTTSSTAALPEEPASEIVFRTPEIDRSQNTFPILFTEAACASGARADDRYRMVVTETAESIAVRVFVTRRAGDQGCPSNPWTPAVVELEAPVGDRKIEGVTQPLDEVISPLTVFADSGLTLPPNIEFIDVDRQLGVYAEVRCEDIDLAIGPELSRPGPYLGADDLLATALNVLGGPQTGWFRSSTPDGFTVAVQFYEGTVVGSIVIYQTSPGWGMEAARCADMPEGWQPDAELPEPDSGARPQTTGTPAAQQDLDRATAVLEAISAIQLTGNGFVFVDPQQRCSAMIEIEDALHAGGFSLWSTGLSLDEDLTPGEGQSVPRQSRTILATDNGGAIVLETGPGSSIGLTLRPDSFPGGFGESSVMPCFLDASLTVNVQAPS